MRQDIAEFLKSRKPSLVSIIMEEEKRRGLTAAARAPRRYVGRLLTITAAGLVVMAGLAAFLYYRSLLPGTSSTRPEAVTPTPPAAPFYVEGTISLRIEKTARALRAALAEAAGRPDALGSIKRLLILAADTEGRTQYLSAKDFFATIGVSPPESFLETPAAPIQFFVFWQSAGPRLGIIGETANPARTFQALYNREAALVSNFAVLFIEDPARPAGPITGPRLEPFQDKTYRNTDFRYLALDADRDLGIGYVIFPAKNIFAVATSEGTLRQVIQRLLQAR